MKIEILGMGCPKCKKLYENTQTAVEELNLQADIVKIEDLQEIVSHGVMTTPALVIDGKIRISGNVPDVAKIKDLISQG